MKITQRRSRAGGGVFNVSVPEIRRDKVERALNELEELEGRAYSQIITDLVLREIERKRGMIDKPGVKVLRVDENDD